MAKGNLFLGTAAKSVGDVVMYRREGAQVSRVRVRNVANPRTNAQSTQRAFFAPVAKFFSPLSTVLARAWEGQTKSKSYSKFLGANVALARQNDWLLPKGIGFFPLPYQLTNGTLPAFNYNAEGTALALKLSGITSGITTIGALSTVLIANGYKANDVVTIVIVKGTIQTQFNPGSCQFIIDAASEVTIASVVSTIGLNYTAPDEGDDSFEFTPKSGTIAAGAVIVARNDDGVWRRSKQFLSVDASVLSNITDADYKAAAIASYGNSASGNSPLVYLDGDELTA